MQEIRAGLVGAGTVGGGVVKIFSKKGGYFNTELALPIRLVRIVDKDRGCFERLPVNDAVCSTDFNDILSDDTISIVIELVGGTTFAKKVVLDALNRKKHVITANKALIAEHGPEIFEAAQNNGVSVYFEASVGGGMPVIKSIREGLVGNAIKSVKTIINGTCNYILTRMFAEGLAFDDVLKEAQARGYAEADPTLDIGGGDTGHKVAILSSIIAGGYIPYEKIFCEGITSVSKDDIECAQELGYTIKLLGIIKQTDNHTVDARVHPVMLRTDHILASVSYEFNAVLLEGDSVGPVLLYGKGAGEMATASAVMSDVIDVARNIASGHPERIPMDYYRSQREIEILAVEEITGRYYVRFTVADQPGVLSDLTEQFCKQSISIASLVQREQHEDESVTVIILTHSSSERSIRAAIAEIEKADYVCKKTQVIRIED